MEYIRKKDVVDRLQALINARKDKNCSKQSIIERTSFEYALAIVNMVETYNIEDKDL